MIYLDHAATTPALEPVLKASWPWLTTEFGNASSAHELGLRARAALEEARETVARILNARSSEIYFTSGATESNNLGIKGIALANPRGRHIVSAPTEHSSVLNSIDYLVRHHNFAVTWLAVDSTGLIDPAELVTAIRPDTTLVALMWINNETGTRAPIAEVAHACQNAGVPLHVDAVQAAQCELIDLQQLPITSLALSGHKIGAPKGSGALFMRNSVVFEAQLDGGGQESGKRSGTENVAWAVAFARALELSCAKADPLALEAAADLTGRFIEVALDLVPGAKLTGSQDQRSPLIASFVFDGVNGETILLELERRGIICSSGSACAAGSTEPSHVLTAMGYSPDLAQTAVRFSFAKSLSAANPMAPSDAFDPDSVAAALGQIVKHLRS